MKTFPYPHSLFPRFILSLFLILTSAGSSFAAPLQLKISFDNEYINSKQSQARYLEVLVTAAKSVRQRQRVPLNLALVIDTSGSMAQQNKLNYVKQAAIAMLNRLQPEDRLSIITYANEARVLFPSRPVQGSQELQWLINSLRPIGSTNLGAGLTEGYGQIQHYASSKTINRLILLSDGKANVGITSSAQLANQVLQRADGGISLSSFGVGLDFNEDLLAALSESGRGMYYFIDHPESMHTILGQEFNSVEQLAVADIKVTIILGADLMVDQVFANNSEVSGNRVSVRFGDLAAGERRRLQVRFLPKRSGSGIYNKAARVDVSYLLPGSSQPLTLSQNLGLTYTEDEKTAALHQDKAISERAAVFEANYAQAEAAKAFDQGDQNKADTILQQAKKKLEAAPMGKSRKVLEEISGIATYQESLKESMSTEQRNLEQKRVKRKNYMIEGD